MSVRLTTDRLDLVALNLARDLGELHAMFAEFSLRLPEGHLLPISGPTLPDRL